MTDQPVYFWQGEDILSNFYEHPFEYKGYTLHFSEQGFMLEKAILFDPEQVPAILSATAPMEAKQAGRAVRNFDESVWSQVGYEVMRTVLIAKFAVPELNDFLLSTGNRLLVEASPFDRIWGVGLGADNPRIADPQKWRGENLLGKVLMEIREYYREHPLQP